MPQKIINGFSFSVFVSVIRSVFAGHG